MVPPPAPPARRPESPFTAAPGAVPFPDFLAARNRILSIGASDIAPRLDQRPDKPARPEPCPERATPPADTGLARLGEVLPVRPKPAPTQAQQAASAAYVRMERIAATGRLVDLML